MDRPFTLGLLAPLPKWKEPRRPRDSPDGDVGKLEFATAKSSCLGVERKVSGHVAERRSTAGRVPWSCGSCGTWYRGEGHSFLVPCSLVVESTARETSFTVDRRQTGSSRLVLTDSGEGAYRDGRVGAWAFAAS